MDCCQAGTALNGSLQPMEIASVAALPSSVDVLILGGGPAGSALAITLRQHAPDLCVALIERSDYSLPHIGETLPPQVGALLRQLGVWAEFQTQGHIISDGTCAASGHAECILTSSFLVYRGVAGILTAPTLIAGWQELPSSGVHISSPSHVIWRENYTSMDNGR